ncbi:MAS20-domain-containing protein [Obba rivulosa]|uniref:MAS20-domain-containing protein n=1 Tax=Obba rivulosa TaxID=1052685 RepID=A0A8E2AU05_9APHY|nr:MAS20-domain-containing protein [Obba rivulosa]
MVSRSSLVTLASVTVVTGIVAYAVYFDYRRRNDVEFRKKLKKEKKKVDKHVAQAETEKQAASGVSAEELRAALAKIREEEHPISPGESEKHFMAQVGLGEQFVAQGEAFFMPAALSFFRALRVYPSPVELIMLYQQTLPEPVFKIVMELANMDVEDRVQGYYNHFPPSDMNVSVQPSADGTKKIIVANKDFEEGEVIYKELPVVADLDMDLQGKGTHCSYCLRQIGKGMTIRPEYDSLGAVYCSRTCQIRSKTQSENLLFGADSVLPEDSDNGLGALVQKDRKKAQTAFVEYIKSKGRLMLLLVARVFARQIACETLKLNPAEPIAEYTKHGLVETTYSIFDHMQRLRFVEGKVTQDERKLLAAVMGAALPGVSDIVTDERLATDVGRMSYNVIGICPTGGREDRPAPDERPEDQLRTRTPYGTSKQVGCGLYLVSAYIAHSCAPNAKPSFPSGTSELHMVATQYIKKGEEITMAYVDVSQHPDETPVEARRRRRIELARGWRFKCECPRCGSEVTESEERDIGVKGDEAKVEDVVSRVESGNAGTANTALD